MTARTSKYRFLTEDHPDVSAHEVPVDGVFHLVPPDFAPLDNEPALSDGEPPTMIGQALIKRWAEITGNDPDDCPAGLVRAVEAVAIPNQDNVTALQRARWRRNSSGLALVAQIECFVPMVHPATVNPRMAARAQRYMVENFGRSLVHEIRNGMRIELIDAEHVVQINDAQRDVRDPHDYTGEAVKTFADSLALEGIREELRGFVFKHVTSSGEVGYLAETDDGWTRVSVAQAYIGNLTGVPADLSLLHWENGDGTHTVRDWTPDAIRHAWRELRFEHADFQVWPDTITSRGIARWIANASRHALSTMRMMTARFDAGLAVQPYAGCRDHDVVYADMARFHVKGQNPELWSPADDEAFRARMVFSSLAEHNYITEEQKRVFFGEEDVAWRDDPDRAPFRNRVVAATAAMVAGVVDDPNDSARYREVLSVLERARAPKSPLQSATVAAALAAVVAGLEGSGDIGQFTAALKRSFRKGELRKVDRHRGNWVEQYQRDIDAIVEDAHDEFATVKGTPKHLDLGPNQLALAVLAFVAHAANPALRNYTLDDGKKWPSSMTLTGRGGRPSLDSLIVPKTEADVIVRHMAASHVGIAELAAIVKASVEHDDPVVPIDPEGTEDMLEEWLRLRWTYKPDSDGTPRKKCNEDGPGPPDPDGTEDPDEDDFPTEFPDAASWDNAVRESLDRLQLLSSRAAQLEEVPAPPGVSLLVDEPDEWDPEDERLERIIDLHGIDPNDEAAANEQIEVLRNFLRRGVLGYYRNRGR